MVVQKAISVLIIDDEVALVAAWARYLEMMGIRARAVRSLGDAAPLLAPRAWQASPYDVVLLDLQLPDGDGQSLVPVLEGLRPAPRIAVLSGHLDSARAVELAGARVVGVPKPIESRTLLRLVQFLGDLGQDAETFKPLFEQYRFSPRERQLLELATAGTDNHEAARALGCRRGTITTYWRRIFRKTGLSSQREVLAHFMTHALRSWRAPMEGTTRLSS